MSGDGLRKQNVSQSSPEGQAESDKKHGLGTERVRPDQQTARAFAAPSAGAGGVLEFVRFALVGVMNTAVDFAVFTVLVWLGVHYLAAQPVSYGAGTLNSYVVNKLWTFRGQGQSVRDRRKLGAEALRFVSLNVGALLVSIALLYLLKDGLGIAPLYAKLMVMAVTVGINYIGSKWWVFR